MVDALVPQEPREDAAVGGEPRERDPGVLGDAEDLALVGRELGGGLVGGGDDGVGAGSETHAGGALLDGLHGVLHLEEPPLRAPCRHVGVVLVAEHPRSSLSLSLLLLLDSKDPECGSSRVVGFGDLSSGSRDDDFYGGGECGGLLLLLQDGGGGGRKAGLWGPRGSVEGEDGLQMVYFSFSWAVRSGN